MNIKILVSTLVIMMLIFGVENSININKRQVNDIESLLEKLENTKIENSVEEVKPTEQQSKQSTLNVAVQQIVSALQQYINAHITLLTGISRSLRVRQQPSSGAYFQSMIGLKQLEENIGQFQETISEFTRQINGILTRGGPPNGNVALDQLTKFIGLWQKQIRDVGDQFNKAIGGLEAVDANGSTTNPSNAITSGNPVLDLFQQIFGVFQNAFQRIRDQFSRLFPVQQYLENGSTAEQIQLDALENIQKTLDNFQTEYQELYQKLSNVLKSSKNDGKLLADDSNGPQLPFVPQLIGLQQIQQLFDTFQKQLASLVNQFSRVFTGQVRP